MLYYIILGVAAFVLYKLFMGDRRKKMEEKQKETDAEVEAGEMVRDPVCGTYVSAESRIRVKEGEKVHCFCSYECRDSFLSQRGLKE